MKISVTEMQSFQRCRRAWHLQSQNRLGLVKVGMPPAALQLGSGVHAALAAQGAKSDASPLVAAKEYFETEEQRLRENYYAIVGTSIDDVELENFRTVASDAYALVTRYFDRYGWQNPLGENYSYVATEMGFEIPIEGTRHHLIGTFDGIALEKSTGLFWLVEHKTYSQQPNEDKMSTDWQLSCYCWAAEQLNGVPIAGVLYDGIAKKLPKQPALGVKGKLSIAQQTLANTDYTTYFDTIRQYDLNPDDYVEVLEQLRARDASGETPFFTRWKIPITRSVIEQTHITIQALAREMASTKTAIVPNFRWEGCFDCRVRDLCKAMQFGEDVEWLIKTAYRRGEGHTTVKRNALPRKEIQSLGELLEP